MRLTADEIKLAAFICVFLVVGAVVKHYRHPQPVSFPPPAATEAAPAPTTPGDLE